MTAKEKLMRLSLEGIGKGLEAVQAFTELRVVYSQLTEESAEKIYQDLVDSGVVVDGELANSRTPPTSSKGGSA